MTETQSARRAAANWHILLRDEPDNVQLSQQFAEWLATDPRHAQAWAAINKTVATLQNAPPERQAYVLPGQGRKSLWATLSFRFAVSGMAAFACLALFLFGEDTLLWLRSDYYTGYSQTQHIQLADGSTVNLAPRSAIAVHLTPTDRRITLLRGEALFNVSHNALRPFVVTTPNARATDLGTVFDITAEHGKTTLAVKEGSSRLEALGSLGRWNDLHAGEWMSVSGVHTLSGRSEPDRIGTWVDGVLVARTMRVADLIARLRPWTHKRIIVLDGSLAEKQVTGVYDLTNPLKALQLAVRPHNGKVDTLLPGVLLVTGTE